VTVSITIETLGPHNHDRKGFSCGVAALDRYFRELAMQDARRRVSNCFVAVAENGDRAGYYTFAATSLPMAELTPEETKRLPRYPLMPAGLIGRLAVDSRYAGKRIGSSLIMDAVVRATRSDPAIFAVVVDAKDEAAVAFYQHLGFRRFASRPISLFLPVSAALEAMEEKA
jgi:ribosomal protein S18 acetylase RimI-like enzyme